MPNTTCQKSLTKGNHQVTPALPLAPPQGRCVCVASVARSCSANDEIYLLMSGDRFATRACMKARVKQDRMITDSFLFCQAGDFRRKRSADPFGRRHLCAVTKHNGNANTSHRVITSTPHKTRPAALNGINDSSDYNCCVGNRAAA